MTESQYIDDQMACFIFYLTSMYGHLQPRDNLNDQQPLRNLYVCQCFFNCWKCGCELWVAIINKLMSFPVSFFFLSLCVENLCCNWKAPMQICMYHSQYQSSWEKCSFVNFLNSFLRQRLCYYSLLIHEMYVKNYIYSLTQLGKISKLYLKTQFTIWKSNWFLHHHTYL